MKVGDLVKRANVLGSKKIGLITKRSSPYRFHVEWASGEQRWYHVDNLEVI